MKDTIKDNKANLGKQPQKPEQAPSKSGVGGLDKGAVHAQPKQGSFNRDKDLNKANKDHTGR